MSDTEYGNTFQALTSAGWAQGMPSLEDLLDDFEQRGLSTHLSYWQPKMVYIFSWTDASWDPDSGHVRRLDGPNRIDVVARAWLDEANRGWKG